nr:hypothetical protein Iba_chr11dCG9780 [Ipomoea batatas]GME09211.1 hypothetical protein Iba_scaffold8369CG0020 [Ipomoea batatas]
MYPPTALVISMWYPIIIILCHLSPGWRDLVELVAAYLFLAPSRVTSAVEICSPDVKGRSNYGVLSATRGCPRFMENERDIHARSLNLEQLLELGDRQEPEDDSGIRAGKMPAGESVRSSVLVTNQVERCQGLTKDNTARSGYLFTYGNFESNHEELCHALYTASASLEEVGNVLISSIISIAEGEFDCSTFRQTVDVYTVFKGMMVVTKDHCAVANYLAVIATSWSRNSAYLQGKGKRLMPLPTRCNKLHLVTTANYLPETPAKHAHSYLQQQSGKQQKFTSQLYPICLFCSETLLLLSVSDYPSQPPGMFTSSTEADMKQNAFLST